MFSCMLGIATADVFGNFVYTDEGASVTITGYVVAPEGNLIIPDTITISTDPLVVKPVTAIGPQAFYNTSISSVTIPSSVTSIGGNAFGFCFFMESVVGAAGVESIGAEAFSGCFSLVNVTIPSGLSSIADNTFNSCPITNITIPAGVESIGNYAFYGCSLTNVTFGGSSQLVSIGEFAFGSCLSLPAMSLPDGVVSVGANAFAFCSLLQSLTFPSSVTSIGVGAFFKCSSLTGIVLPPGLTTISNGLFQDCFELISVTIPPGVAIIGDDAFRTCIKLTGMTMPSSVATIGSNAFLGCSLLAEINFAGNAPGLGSNVFTSTAAGLTFYYTSGASGFGVPPWTDYTTVATGEGASQLVDWLAFHGLPANPDFSSDDNLDGVSLLMAYALDLDPNLTQSGSLPKPVIVGNTLRISFYSARPDITYVVKTSTDNLAWTTAGVSLTQNGSVSTASVDMVGSARFLKLWVNN
jgi:hypothetical protein